MNELFTKENWIITTQDDGLIHYEHIKKDMSFTVDPKDPEALIIQLLQFYQLGVETGYKKRKTLLKLGVPIRNLSMCV